MSSIEARKLRRTIFFRGAADGVLSHYFYPGFRIRDTPENPVRFIIDAGANIGDETLRFRYFHPEALVVALEPESGNYEMLARNTAGDERTIALQAGLWSHECALAIAPNPEDNKEAFRVTEAPAGAPGTIPACSVPSLMNRFDRQTVDILKMDIEGAEDDVFARGAEEWIGRVKVFIFECPDGDRPGAALRIFRKLSGQNLNCYIQGENLVLIRADTGWKIETNLFLPERGSLVAT